MDTKLKSYSGTRWITWAVSSALAVIAAEVTIFAGCMLVMAYSFEGSAGYWKEYGKDGMDAEWISFSVEGIDEVVSELWMIAGPAVLIALIALAVSVVTVGRKDETGRLILNRFDRIFTDVQIAAMVGIAFLIALMCVVHVDWLAGSGWYRENLIQRLTPKELKLCEEYGGILWNVSSFHPRWLEIAFAVIGNSVLIGVFLMLFQSVIKKIKDGSFWKHTIVGRIIWHAYDAAKASEGVFWKLMAVLIGGMLLSATWFGIIPVLILILIFVPKWAKKYTAIKEGVSEIKNGNLAYKIPVTDNGELDRLASDINTISDSLNVAVQNELKNQRLKTDLISNVSHDLRTPLTSMVSYVDLLKTEGLDSENAPSYFTIIDEKTRRLQKLTEDLFEAAKASSGSIPVDIVKIEMSSIVNQAMAELEERLAANEMDVIYTNKAETIYVMADGQLLWRVIENLLTNVSKYALPKSRVYLDIREDEQMIYLDVKNISKDRLNISADELMERFKRGDESRNTEGSGLGLSIAKDLTSLMHGKFSIVIDGDLFKATVALQKA